MICLTYDDYVVLTTYKTTKLSNHIEILHFLIYVLTTYKTTKLSNLK